MRAVAEFVGCGFREKTMDAFFLGSKEHEAMHARLARIALISFSRRAILSV